MTTSNWLCYFFEPQPLLVLEAQPEVYIPLKRMPEEDDYFRWNNDRWRVTKMRWWREDAFGDYRALEAISTAEDVTFLTCSGCGGIVSCSDTCRVGLHREGMQASAPRPRKQRSNILDAPLRLITHRKGNVETLACGHSIHYRFFKYVDRTASYRRCLECCNVCGDVQRTVKRPRIL